MSFTTESTLLLHEHHYDGKVYDFALESNADQQKFLYLAGIDVGHSIGAPMHELIAKSLGKPWTFINQECPTVEDAVRLFRHPTFAGGVITMPYKKTIIPYLDEVDDYVVRIGACNNVHLTPNGVLRGSNTDWRGIKGSLISSSAEGIGKPALIIGAGGACRAAIYALFAELQCTVIYIINRDKHEVEDLISEMEAYSSDVSSRPKLIHVTSTEQVDSLPEPLYVVGTVPDMEPRTAEELEVSAILHQFLDNSKSRDGVLLDMCYKPRNTRIIKYGKSQGWKTVDGTAIIGHQADEQWRLWAGEDAAMRLPTLEAWKILNRAADTSKELNE